MRDLGFALIQVLQCQTEKIGGTGKTEPGPGRIVAEDRNGESAVGKPGREVVASPAAQYFCDREYGRDLFIGLFSCEQEVRHVQPPGGQPSEVFNFFFDVFTFHFLNLYLSLQQPYPVVEIFDQRIDLFNLRERPVPIQVMLVPLLIEFIDVATLLLDPGEVFEVVDRFAIVVGQFLYMVDRCRFQKLDIPLGVCSRVWPMLLREIRQTRSVKLHGIRGDGDNDIFFSQLTVLGEFDRSDQIADSGYAQKVELCRQSFRNAFGDKGPASVCFVEKTQQPHG
jgi:hypothetical protein